MMRSDENLSKLFYFAGKFPFPRLSIMKPYIFLIGMAAVGTAIAGTVSNSEDLLSPIAQRSEKLVCVMDKPHRMSPQVAVICGPAASIPKPEGPHTGKFYHVYITKSGLGILKEAKGTYPEGTVVVKEKFSNSEGKNTELFTAMVKREKGFHPDGGDWEYFVISGDSKKITQSGKIQSCMECHDTYSSTDYVTRDYMGH
jgi:hypothetical protein